MVMNQGNFGDLIAPTQLSIYGLKYEAFEKVYPKVFREDTSQLAYEESLSMTDFGQVPVKIEGQSVTFNDAKQNWKHRLTHIAYGLGYVVTWELFHNQFHKQIQMLPANLAKSVNDTVETTTANVLNNGFDSNFKGGDGVELFSSVHPLGGGGTYRNELETPADLSATSLEQAIIDIKGWKTNGGLKMNARIMKIIHTENLTWDVMKLLGSSKDPESANNTMNPAHQLYPSQEWVFLSDPDAWFLTTNVPQGLVHYWRRKPDFTRDNEFDTENAKFKVIFNDSAGWDDPRGVFGSSGG